MRRGFFTATLLLISIEIFAQSDIDGWKMFARVKFNSTFIKELNEYYLVPAFDKTMRESEGAEVTLKGHYMPMENDDSHVIVLSKFPYSMCFFCGGAGPESVAEVVFESKPPRLKVDQVITVKGRLKLNNSDVNHLNFILTESTLLTK